MKPTAAITVTTVGGFGPDTTNVKMGIDESNFEHIMMLLTDLYSDQILAVVREYSTNARDSHKEAGVDRPIEVTLPSVMSPFFKVRDYGTGLSADEAVNVYSKYGSSTKRDSNDFNGMLGLGCKSALTYTNQFTVVSVKHGEKITILISRSGSVPTLEIIDKQAGVSEPNGVEVQVPVKPSDVNSFSQKAAHLFGFWTPGTVTVNGRPPATHTIKTITPNIGTASGFGTDIVVMGGVPYPVAKRLFSGTRPHYNSFDVVARVDIGDVTFTPSREALMYTKHTEATIERLRLEFEATIVKTIKDDIDAQPTHAKAYAASVKWKEQFGSVAPSPATYKGQPIPTMLNFRYDKWDTNSYTRSAYAQNFDKIDMSNLVKALVIYDFPQIKLSSTHKAKIKQWKATKGISASYHVFTAGKEGDPWVPADRMVSWDEIKKELLPGMGGNGQPRKKPSIDIYDRVDGYTQNKTLDDTKIPVYISPTARLGSNMAKTLYALFPDIEIVSLGENRWDKFVRENPKAVRLRTYLEKKVNEARDNLTPRDIMSITLDTYEARKVANLDATKVNDPALKEYIEIVQQKDSSPTAAHFIKMRDIGYRFHVRIADLPQTGDGKVLENYPLLSSHRDGTLAEKHTYIYVNAAYAANV